MELDLDTFLTALYTVVDDLYAARLAGSSNPVVRHGRPPFRVPRTLRWSGLASRARSPRRVGPV